MASDTGAELTLRVLVGMARGLDLTVLRLGGYRMNLATLLAVLVVLALTGILSRGVQRGIRKTLGRYDDRVSAASQYTITRVASYGVLLAGGLTALNVAGISMSRLLVLMGGLGVGLGFGLQQIFNNFMSGLILLFERSLKVGDYVELASGVKGTVQEIRIRFTRVTTNEDVDVLVPNSEFISGRVVNWTLHDDLCRLAVPFGVAYGSDKEEVRRAALKAAASVPLTLPQEGNRVPQVLLTGFGDSSLNFQLLVWVKPEGTRNPLNARGAYCWALETALGEAGIELPWPQRDLRVRSWFGLEGEAARREVRELAARGLPEPSGRDGAPAVEEGSRGGI